MDAEKEQAKSTADRQDEAQITPQSNASPDSPPQLPRRLRRGSTTRKPSLSPGAPRLTNIEQLYHKSPEEVPRRIHLVGTGSIGKLVAHALRSLPDPPPVTLIFHRRRLLEAWNDGPKEITIHRDDTDIRQSGFDVELAGEVRRLHGVRVEENKERLFDDGRQAHLVAQEIGETEADVSSWVPRRRRNQVLKPAKDDIHHLIVTTKTHMTVGAIMPLRHRLSEGSTICLLQNGMGVIDELNEKVFTDPTKRPKYIQGIITHGANVPPEQAQQDPFFAVHAGQGTIALSLVSPEPIVQQEDTRYLIRTLTRSPVLMAVAQTPTELLQLQLEKLAVNCVLNPLTSLIDARNGALLYNFALTRTMRLMLAEISLVIRSLPELQGMPNVAARFSASRLEAMCVNVATTTAQNISSMLADVRAGRSTEIEFINGYIVKRGEEQGIKCVVNYGIMQTVIGKAMLIGHETQGDLPTTEAQDLNQGL